MQVKEPTFSVSNMFTFNSQQYFKYFDSEMFMLVGIKAMHKCFMDEGIALLSNISSIAQFILFGIGSKELYLDIGNSDEITLF